MNQKAASPTWRMTYNRRGITGCSARGISIKDTKEELELLAEALKKSICNIEIKQL